MADDLEPLDLAMLLNHTNQVLHARLAVELADIGISFRERCVLVKARGEARTQREIAALSELDKTTMVVTLDGLEERGLAERVASPTDRRARIVSVTPKGEAAAARSDEVVQRLYDEVLSVLPATKRKAFVTGLRTLMAGPLSGAG
jgi:MarR family transcriptional regulator for hemolysin